MTTYHIDLSICDRSPGCPARRACPQGAIVPVEGGAYPGGAGYTVIEERCTGCGACMRACPARAVSAR